MRTRPWSGGTNPHINRIVVVLPAPSGPINPNISPRSTDNVSSLTAAVVPNFLVTRSSAMGLLVAKWDLGLHGHSSFEDTGAVVDRHLHSINQLRALVGGLDIARREFCFRRDEAHGSRNSGAAGVGEQRGRLSEM